MSTLPIPPATGGPSASPPAPPAAGGPAAGQHRRAARAALLEQLREARGSDALITYITSTRPGLQAMMTQDAIRVFFDHLPAERVGKLDLLIHSDGGDRLAPSR